MDAYEEKLAEILRRLGSRAREWSDRANCPDDETLVNFLGGGLGDDAKELIECHLARCSFCLEDLVAAYSTGQDYDIERVPQRLIDKAMGLVQGKETLFDVVARLVTDSIELVSSSARVIPAPVPATVRGGAKPPEGSVLQVEKEVGRFRVAVELELVEAGMCQVIANVTEERGRPADGIRLSLSSEGREQASFLTRDGRVLFDRISPGEYSIAVSDSGTPVGRIKLSLML